MTSYDQKVQVILQSDQIEYNFIKRKIHQFLIYKNPKWGLQSQVRVPVYNEITDNLAQQYIRFVIQGEDAVMKS